MPSHPPSLQPAVHNFSTHARTVLSLLLRLSASALGLEEDYFSSLYDQRAACNLKLSWYPAVPDTGGDGRQPRYGAHTDCEQATPAQRCVSSSRFRIRGVPSSGRLGSPAPVPAVCSGV
eukprot:scaffold11685_cov56-Isochrysis_galbana.AAC.1